MGGILSSLNTSYTGLQAHQLMVDVTSNNISNASNEFYTRERVIAHPQAPLQLGNLNVGTGTTVDSIQRLHDEFAFDRYTKAARDHNFYKTEFESLREANSYFPDLQNVGIYNDLEHYFDAWKDVAKNPNNVSQKQVLVKNANVLTNDINTTKEKLLALQKTKSDELEAQVKDANRLGSQIAKINQRLNELEDRATLKQANELRDRRDELEFRLQEIIGGNVFKKNIQANNLVDSRKADFDDGYTFNIGHGFNMIDGSNFHPIVLKKDNNPEGLNRIYIRGYDFKDVDITDRIDEGKAGALLDLYNTGYSGTKTGKIQNYINLLDSFAKGMIHATNTIYAQSAAKEITGDKTSIMDFDALKDTNYKIHTGTFTLNAYNNQGDIIASKTITIGATTTMKDVVNQINANTDDNKDNNSLNDFDDFFHASYDNNTKQFSIRPKSSTSGMSVSIKDHDTNFIGALGLNRFFEGNDASTMHIARIYQRDPGSIRAHLAPVSGNFEIANMMQQLQYNKVEFYDEHSNRQEMKISDFYQYVAGSVANQTQDVKTTLDTKDAVMQAAKKEHLSISQVSVDDEMVNLIKFQSGYAANAKVITAIDRMIDTLLSIKQ
ncbi:flagellar hook-associated protein FlgK [Helicobacter sp. 13S00401-1]|uniref:flagellar hook-associated protein FlgK n=1 Tax=Helicobacter sp. 13S00401-1 TaxID=1905758 RepID=UPI000BA77A10|nr:flagellar hook-associated protein FlgK [Helicobacter sp. 13S00401-1]PAF49032.1 flagellar hook-associated protein FlgK [Helicobacter sp. 13S00401-1]